MLEGEESLYQIKLNGPPPESIRASANTIEGFTRWVRKITRDCIGSYIRGDNEAMREGRLSCLA